MSSREAQEERLAADARAAIARAADMRVAVGVETPYGERVLLAPGDVIGRLAGAALRMNDPCVSEAHALVSLRGDTLKLLGLRGRLWVGGAIVPEVALAPGLIVGLGPGIELTVVSVRLPQTVLAIAIDGGRGEPLPVVATLSEAGLTPGFAPNGEVLIWSDGDAFHVRLRGRPDTEIGPGFEWRSAGHTYRIVELPLAAAATEGTTPIAPCGARVVLRVPRPELQDPQEPADHRRRQAAVVVERPGESHAITGLPALILEALVAAGEAVDWRELAKALWRDEDDVVSLRQKWDAALARLRRRLQELGVRADVVRTNGFGLLGLNLGDDVVVEPDRVA